MKGLSRAVLSMVLLLTAVSAGLAEQGKTAVDRAALSRSREWFDKGSHYAGQQQSESAIEAYTKALELNPAFVEAFNARGTMYVRTGRSERALEDFNKAIALDPKNDGAYNNRGMIFIRRGNYRSAVEDLSKAISVNPGRATYYSNRAAAYAGQKQFEKSIADYTIVIGMDPSNADAYAGRGSAAYALGRTDQAAVDLKKACSLGSDSGCKSVKALAINK